MTAPAQRWGTGFGAKRHVVDENTVREKVGRRGMPLGTQQATAVCSSTIFLEFFSDATDTHVAERVMEKAACGRCVKALGQAVCPTCNGAGTVGA